MIRDVDLSILFHPSLVMRWMMVTVHERSKKGREEEDNTF